MDRGAWWATGHGVTESDTTRGTWHALLTNPNLGQNKWKGNKNLKNLKC